MLKAKIPYTEVDQVLLDSEKLGISQSLSESLTNSLMRVIRGVENKKEVTVPEINAICNCASQVIKIMHLNINAIQRGKK